MKKIITVLFLLLLTFSSANAGCRSKAKMIEVGADTISKHFVCQNKEQVKIDLSQTMEVTGLCSMRFSIKEKTACKIFGKYAALLIVNQVPESWDCSSLVENEQLATAFNTEIREACLKAIR